jgi:hypothetical protein
MTTAESPLFTLRQVAKMLDADVEAVFELACDMGPREGCVSVHDEAFSHDDAALLGTAFTNAGIEFLQARLAERANLH